ncbi:hypothetical protein JCM8547_003426 [Rhodosporidiobolus lusitaniae]
MRACCSRTGLLSLPSPSHALPWFSHVATPSTRSSRPSRIAVLSPHHAPRAAMSVIHTFSSSSFRSATPTDSSPDLTFPSSANPSPFDIFHFSRDAPLTPKIVKARFYELSKLYHPDRRVAAGTSSRGGGKGKGKAKKDDDDYEFKQIVAAYELLSDPAKRATYLRTGMGWGKTSGFGGGGGGWPASPYSQSTGEYHFRRGRPYSGPAGGAYAYDWRASQETWSDPYNPHFRPHASAGMSPNASAAGWHSQGALGKNGAIFLALFSITLLVTPLSAWYAVPPELVGGRAGEGGEMAEGGAAWLPRVYDQKHRNAAENLRMAREEARVMGHEKREAIRRRVQQIRQVEAHQRAMEVQAVENQRLGTGHLSLPPPSAPLALPPPASPP